MAEYIVIVAAILCALLIWINRRQIFRAVGWLVLAFILFAAYLHDKNHVQAPEQQTTIHPR